MKRQYGDLYALFRHEAGAEEYFNALPSYVQDRLIPLYRNIDSFERLKEYAKEHS